MNNNFYVENKVLEGQKQEAIAIEKGEKMHAVSSDIRHPGRSISIFKGGKQHVLDYDKYFVGRSFQLFKRGIKAAETLEDYKRKLYYFCEYLDKTTDQIVEQHGPFKKVNGKNKPNPEGMTELQKHIENYVLKLQELVDSKKIKPTTCVSRIPPIKLFCEMNDLTLNWRKIGKLLPRSDLVADDQAYNRDQIKTMLGFCDLRTRVILLFLASSGMRLGGLAGLKHGNLEPVYDEKEPSKVIAVHLKVYAGTESEYYTFMTPEAWHAYVQYIAARQKLGEKMTGNSPVLLSRFSKKSMKEGTVKSINPATIYNLLSLLRYKAELSVKNEKYNSRFTIKGVHSLRKFWNTTVKSVKTPDGNPAISFVNKERMLGHTLVNEFALENNYDRGDKVKELLSDYLKAVPELTITDEARLQVQVKKLQVDIGSLKSVEVEMALKDRQMQEMEERHRQEIQAVREDQQEIKELFKHPEKLLAMLNENKEKNQ